MEHVEEERLEKCRVCAHRLEVEHLEPFDGQRVLEVVEQARVAPTLDPLVQASRQRTGQQVRHREQPPLALVEHVEVLDALVDFPVLQVAQSIPVIPLEQHANEGVKKMQVLWRGFQRERVDRQLLMAQAEFEVAAAQQRGELSIAVPEIEDHGQRLVLLRVGDEEVQEKALAAARGAQHQRVPDVLDVQIERVRRVVRRLEDRQRLSLEVCAHSFALIEREHEAQIRRIRFQQRQTAQVVSAVPRDDAQPGVQKVVGLVEHSAVVDSEWPSWLRRPAVEGHARRSRAGPGSANSARRSAR